MRALPGFFAALLSIALAVPGGNRSRPSADEVIALARAALGGEAALDAVRSLSASGTARPRKSGGLDLERPRRSGLLRVDAHDGERAGTGTETRCLAAVLLPGRASEVRFSYVGEVEAPRGRSDVVDLTAPHGLACRLFVDQASHLPLMLTDAGLRPPVLSGEPAQTLTLFLSDYREVDGIRLPHALSRAVNGALVEEWRIDRWRVNPPLEATSFPRSSEP